MVEGYETLFVFVPAYSLYDFCYFLVSAAEMGKDGPPRIHLVYQFERIFCRCMLLFLGVIFHARLESSLMDH